MSRDLNGMHSERKCMSHVGMGESQRILQLGLIKTSVCVASVLLLVSRQQILV